jgi:hypothetical protein
MTLPAKTQRQKTQLSLVVDHDAQVTLLERATREASVAWLSHTISG